MCYYYYQYVTSHHVHYFQKTNKHHKVETTLNLHRWAPILDVAVCESGIL